MMTLQKMTMPVMAALLLGACGGTSVCDKPKLYQQSQLGKRIEVPEGLSPLQAGREMTIPDASPRDPRPAGAPCLEMPPTFTTGE
jgi:uncharacterized lipoprotein